MQRAIFSSQTGGAEDLALAAVSLSQPDTNVRVPTEEKESSRLTRQTGSGRHPERSATLEICAVTRS